MLRTQLNAAVLFDGHLYGADGDTTQSAALKCVEGLRRDPEAFRSVGCRHQFEHPALDQRLAQMIVEMPNELLLRIELAEGDPLAADLRGVIAILCAGAGEIGLAMSARAKAVGLPVNVMDDLAHSTFIFPAIVDRGDVVVAVGTGGTSPVVARRVRERIEAVLPARIGDLAGFIGRWRKTIHGRIPEFALRRRFWERVVDGPIGALVLAGHYLDCGDWWREAAFDRVVICVNLIGQGVADKLNGQSFVIFDGAGKLVATSTGGNGIMIKGYDPVIVGDKCVTTFMAGTPDGKEVAFVSANRWDVMGAAAFIMAETLGLPLLTDDAKFDGTPGHHAEIHHYPD